MDTTAVDPVVSLSYLCSRGMSNVAARRNPAHCRRASEKGEIAVSLPIEVASRVSERMSTFLESITNDPDIGIEVTLGLARDRLQDLQAALGVETDHHEFGSEQSLYGEMEALIDEYGEDAPAIDFIAVKAGEHLSALIEALLDYEEDSDVAATLGRVREAIVAGLAARLMGEGVIEEDEEQTLLAEVDALIERYGTDMLAESVLGFA